VNSVAQSSFERLRSALVSSRYTGGSTHGFYLYPARFSPEIARAVIETFSEEGQWVLDPFMGGGTAVIEGLAAGRRVIGIDVNALAHFVASVRTRPLSSHDRDAIKTWAAEACATLSIALPMPEPRSQVRNLPRTVKDAVSVGSAQAEVSLRFPRQRAFARCVLLRLGQWSLDCRDHNPPSRRKLGHKLQELTKDLLTGLEEFVSQCGDAGVGRNEIAGRRFLLCRTASGFHDDPRVAALGARPQLVFTSPPYPRVHVLYHRWQVRGRRETPAPYWIAQVPDGYYASHYTGGSRTPSGEQKYFAMVRSVFTSVREFMAPDGLVVQLLGFADVRTQLPKYLSTMSESGFESCSPLGSQERHLWRPVPNRKWYAKLRGAVDPSSEVLLFHRPRPAR